MTNAQEHAVIEPKPELLTNWSGSTVSEGLRNFVEHAASGLVGQARLDVASAYFNAGGYAELADVLDRVGEVRLLLGAEPHTVARRRALRDVSHVPETAQRRSVKRAVAQMERQLTDERDLLGFTLQVEASVGRLVDWLRSPTVHVRMLRDRFLHGKAFLVGTASHGVVAGSSNFTRAGLRSNVELNLGNYSPHVVRRVQEWFDELWEAATDYDAAALFAPRHELNRPRLIYLRMLWERYGGDLTEEVATYDLPLSRLQEDGVHRARRLLADFDGVLLADEVGLGKTFIAGELISEVAIKQRQRVLVVTPATLRDGPWGAFMSAHSLPMDLISYEDLVNGKFLGSGVSGRSWNVGNVCDYAMVVVDEAHNLRNPSTKRAHALRRLMAGSPPKKLVLMTATPVNNSLWDLYNLLSYFLRNDGVFADIGITSLREHFRTAMATNPDSLSPSHLFDVLDAVAVRRTRSFMKQHYRNDSITVAGQPMPVRFPKPRVLKVNYDLDGVLPGFFDRLADALDSDAVGAVAGMAGTASQPSTEPPEGVLTLARYSPSRYLLDPGEKPESYELMLAGLLRSGLLKRFESSPHAFALTCRRMANSCDQFLGLLEEGRVATGDALADWVATDSDDIEEVNEYLYVHADVTTSAGDYDATVLAAHVEHDRDLLHAFADEAEAVTPDADPTLAALADALVDIAAGAHAEGIGDDDTRDRRKVLIFTYYSDTVEWISEFLAEVVERDPRLGDYRGRIAAHSGSEGSRRDVLWGFAPKTTGAPQGPDSDKYDVVVTTDVLAEGVNLQQARHIINYDLPWNPMRLVQRHGRIDRIGSNHSEVFLRCVFPDSRLDDLLGLEERLNRKLKQAAASVGVPDVLPDTERIDRNFAETREEIARLGRGDSSLFEMGGRAAGAMSGEEFRQELRQALADSPTKNSIEGLPWGSGSAMAAEHLAGSGRTGFVFCIRVGDHPEPEFRYVEVEGSVAGDCGSAAAEVGSGGVVAVSEGGTDEPELRQADLLNVSADTLGCLWAARPSEGADTLHSAESVEAAAGLRRLAVATWQPMQAKFVDDWNFFADKANLERSLPKALRDAAEVVRSHRSPDLTQEQIERAVDALQVNYSPRVVRAVGVALRSSDDPIEQVSHVLRVIDELGLQPELPPQRRPFITVDDVHVVCWLALTSS